MRPAQLRTGFVTDQYVYRPKNLGDNGLFSGNSPKKKNGSLVKIVLTPSFKAKMAHLCSLSPFCPA
jgi:hypothetical protein